MLCTATLTYYGWLCSWNTATVPSGSYTLLSEAFGAGGSAFSSGVTIAVKNPPGLADLTGSFSGTTSVTGGCSLRKQVFDATYPGGSAVGSVTLHLDGCIDGAPFTYTGTFTVTTSVGTLAGNVAGTLNNPVTTPPPYVYHLTLTVVSGTGAFSGTTGSIPMNIQWSGSGINPSPMSGSVGVT